MAKGNRDVTEAELNVLRLLWDGEPLTIRQIAESLSDDPDGYYATVKKLLERLESKDFVQREPAGIAYRYHPIVDRDELIGRRLQDVSDSLCDGTVTPLLTQLARHRKLTRKQQQTLLSLIDDLATNDSSKPSNRTKKRGKES